MTLSIELQLIFEVECIQKIEEIINDDMEECGCTEEEKTRLKIIKIGIVVSVLFEEHPEIAEECQYQVVEEWGLVHQLIEVGIAYQAELQDYQMTVTDSETGECNFTKSLKEQCSNDELGAGSSELVLELVATIEYVCLRWENAGYDQGRLFGWLSVAIEMFCDQYDDLEGPLLNCTLNDGTTVREFLHLCEWYETAYSVLVVFSGSASECPLVQTLEEGVAQCQSATESSTPASSTPAESSTSGQSVCDEAAAYVEELKANYSMISDEQERFDCFVESFPELSFECQTMLMVKLVIEVRIEITVGEVLGIGCNCENQYGCGNISEGGPGESYPNTCYVDSKNHSTMVKACEDYNATLSSKTLQNQFKTYYNAIVNCIYSLFSNDDCEGKLECVWDIVDSYATQSYMMTYREAFQNTTICTVLDGDEEDTKSSEDSSGSNDSQGPDSSNDDDDFDDSGFGTIGDGCECYCSQQQVDSGVCRA